MSENVKPMEAREIVTIKITTESRIRYPINRFKITTSGPDGYYIYFKVNVTGFKQLLEQENKNIEELKNAVKSYMEKEKVPDVLKKEIEHNMNNEEAKDNLTKNNCEFNAFMNINGICKMNNIDQQTINFISLFMDHIKTVIDFFIQT